MVTSVVFCILDGHGFSVLFHFNCLDFAKTAIQLSRSMVDRFKPVNNDSNLFLILFMLVDKIFFSYSALISMPYLTDGSSRWFFAPCLSTRRCHGEPEGGDSTSTNDGSANMVY